MYKSTAVGCFLSLFIISQINAQTPKSAAVHIESGNISGIQSADNQVISYKGIPFALPPVGKLRWTAPQPAAPWTGIKVCNTYGPSPFQNKPAAFSMWSEEFLIPKEPISEDCLYLNVWNPVSTNKKKPVLVWIYGGGFNSGGAAAPIYDGEATAKKGVIFVSFNYRVGVFGFFAHPELTKESGMNASGNYGLMDQIAALDWVKKNIAAFGGDPDNVTIAGQSAGSMSVNCLLASPLAKGLFSKAILESGAYMVGARSIQNALAQAESAGSQFASSHNNANLEGLRNISAEQLLKDWRGGARPIVDGYVLTETVQNTFASGKQNKATLMIGWNENEGLSTGPKRNATEYNRDIKASMGANAAQFLKFYPGNTDAEVIKSQADYGRDISFGMQAYELGNKALAAGSKVYMYRFARKLPATGIYIGFGAFHTGEVPYAYNNLKFVDRPWEPVDHQLASTMSDYWTNFAKTGDPNGKSLPVWPVYSTDKQVVILDENPHAAVLPGKEALDLLIKMEH
jgi:para-nitrobenzyl esterase